MFKAIEWKENRLILLNQKLLPHEEKYQEYTDPESVAKAIRDMVVRGAPAIGITAAFGIALGMLQLKKESPKEIEHHFENLTKLFEKTRPTAVNLFWAIKRMKELFQKIKNNPLREIQNALLREAEEILREDIETNKKIGEYGAQLIQDGNTILTYCNAGALATGGYGTATAAIRIAKEQGKQIKVLACETRPYLQGARLTTWELMKDGIDVCLITDNAAGYLLAKGEIDLCIVGTDRTAANGDVANKIGTYLIAIAAKENDIPFYVAAPTSSIDLQTHSGKEIPIEERDPDEVLKIGSHQIAPKNTPARHIAFDITPSRYVTAIITENGIAHPPYKLSLPKLVKKQDKI